MEKTLIILGNGFDLDLGLNLSFEAYCNNPLCFAYKGKRWSDFENYIRKKILDWSCNTPYDLNQAKEINNEWHAFKKRLSYFFTDETTKELHINASSCAYTFLKNISEKSKVYTFNYTYPYEFVDLAIRKELIFVHGRYVYDTFKDDFMTWSQSQNMIVGIDYKRIPNNVKDNENLKCIIKQLNSSYTKTNLENDILEPEYVVFFGFSMSIPDSDYFDNFFSAISIRHTKCKQIYCITKDKKAFNQFIRNIEELGFSTKKICSQVKITPIYTQDGIENEKFKHVLSLI